MEREEQRAGGHLQRGETSNLVLRCKNTKRLGKSLDDDDDADDDGEF